MTAPTPGPWTVSQWSPSEWGVASASRPVASRIASEADARLLAAAPAMLDYIRRYVAASANVGPFPKEARAILRAVEEA